MADIERRTSVDAWPTVDMEVRAEGDGLSFRGYAAVFDTLSEDLGGFRERIAPGAFARAVNATRNGQAEVKMFLNHNQDIALASTKGNTLRLSEDERGLLAEATLADDHFGHYVSKAVRRSTISAMSFGFQVPKGGDSWTTDHKERTLHAVKLLEVSPVTGWPAYSATSASVRTLVDAIDWEDDDAVRRISDLLDERQRDILLRHLNRQSPTPLIDPEVSELLARLEAKRPAA